MQCGQKTSQAVIQDFRVLFSSLQAKAVRDLSTQNISKTDSKLALCCVFEVGVYILSICEHSIIFYWKGQGG